MKQDYYEDKYAKKRRAVRAPSGSPVWMFCLAIGLLLFGSVAWLASGDLSAADEAIGKLNKKVGSMRGRYADLFDSRTVTLQNKFMFDVSVYYEDGMSGSFLANIDPSSFTKISASTGHILYATGQNSLTRIATVRVRPGVDSYNLAPADLDPLNSGGSSDSSDKGSKSDGKKEDGSFSKEHLEQIASKQRVIVQNVAHRSRLHPQISELGPASASHAMATRFRSMVPEGTIQLWYDPGKGKEGIPQGHLKFNQVSSTNCYEGNSFYATYIDGRDDKRHFSRMLIHKEQSLYVIYDEEALAAKGGQVSLPEQEREWAKTEQDFMQAYLKRTGIHYRHYFERGQPRPKVSLFMWPAPSVGAVHAVSSPHGFWSCDGAPADCQSQEAVYLELEAVSVTPRAFVIPGFLSDYEADAIVKAARPRMDSSHVGDTATGVRDSGTRTSRNAWIARHTSAITDTLYRRAADALNIDEAILHHNMNSEDMQVVHYQDGQKYDAHHDWGFPAYNSRCMTLLLYLTDQADPTAGGETSFPKGDDGRGNAFKVRPKKGSAVLFYNLLADGNGDDLALHAAMPVAHGEKYVANFWVWDPKRIG